jgi:hypothetical protein
MTKMTVTFVTFMTFFLVGMILWFTLVGMIYGSRLIGADDGRLDRAEMGIVTYDG